MSQENVEIVRRAWEFEMFGRRREWRSAGRLRARFTVERRSETTSLRFETAWEKLQVEAEEFIEPGSRSLSPSIFGQRAGRAGSPSMPASMRSTRCAIAGLFALTNSPTAKRPSTPPGCGFGAVTCRFYDL
jgi:hypothetical protein